MGRELILDTGAAIHLLHGRTTLDPQDDVALAAVTVAELLAGPPRNPDLERGRAELVRVKALCEEAIVLDYTADTAAHHANLIVETTRQGRRRGAHDLIIAAHAAETGRTLVTYDLRARFGDLRGVDVMEVQP